MPFTSDDFDPQLEQANQLIDARAARGAEGGGDALRDPTASGDLRRQPDPGRERESPASGTRVGGVDQGGPGVGRAVAEWMNRRPQRDRAPPQRHRALPRPHRKRREHTRLRTTESFIKTYGIIHPAEQYASDRDQRLSPMHESQQKPAPRSSRRQAGSGRSGTSPTPPSSRSTATPRRPAEHEWDSRWWSPIINVEHLRMRESAAVIDLSAFQILDISGPGALDTGQYRPARRRRRQGHLPVLDAKGGFLSDLTVMPAGRQLRVVTGGAHGMADRKTFTDQLPDDEAMDLADLTDEVSTIGIWLRGRAASSLCGPRPRCPTPVRLPQQPRSTYARPPSSPPHLLRRRAGLEPRLPDGERRRGADALLEAGVVERRGAAASASTATTGRIEKGYRAERLRA